MLKPRQLLETEDGGTRILRIAQTIYQFLLSREQVSDQTPSGEFHDITQNVLFDLTLQVWHSN